MIKCPFCEAEQVDNTIFCSECGVYLLEDERRGTEALDFDEMDWGDEHEEPQAVEVKPENNLQQSIHLKIGDGIREIEASLAKAIHLGRLDPASDVFPEVDLSDESGLEKGVSRRHARIIKRDETVVVEDLGSINGTFVNGKRLAPYLPETLNDGDQLQLGNLVIEIGIG
ncbi:FHA domain-containing protein [Anaerolineales bacterium HSG6]|nr:FHA domain-containing protein [Anaerolineales bacterium HSG6]